jgi:hypothetical protein
MTTAQKITKAKNILLKSATENKRLQAQILQFADVVEDILSDYEMEVARLETELNKQVVSERYIIAILETYGIDPQTALGRRDNQIMSDHDLAMSCSVYRIPEKLKKHVNYDTK